MSLGAFGLAGQAASLWWEHWAEMRFDFGIPVVTGVLAGVAIAYLSALLWGPEEEGFMSRVCTCLYGWIFVAIVAGFLEMFALLFWTELSGR